MMMNISHTEKILQKSHRLLSPRLCLSLRRYTLGSCIPKTMARVEATLGRLRNSTMINARLESVAQSNAGQARCHDSDCPNESVGLGVGEFLSLSSMLFWV